ncbi:hypothetical protein [Arthrobacter sp. H14]|uniref:hypothetical protein n=1 Tax=Arthrobacter sp. H14 TaxID=1312959 RepID=UPI0004B548F8|nr:hypothetical protein [Arthrobacter sp. H14]
MSALNMLEQSRLVTEDSEPGLQTNTDVSPQKVWRLTAQGRIIARQKAKMLHEWDELFQLELVKLGTTADSAARAVGAVSDSGNNSGDPTEAARRYAATHHTKE